MGFRDRINLHKQPFDNSLGIFTVQSAYLVSLSVTGYNEPSRWNFIDVTAFDEGRSKGN